LFNIYATNDREQGLILNAISSYLAVTEESVKQQEIDRKRKKDRQTEKETKRQRDRETERQRDRETKRQRDRKKEKKN